MDERRIGIQEENEDKKWRGIEQKSRSEGVWMRRRRIGVMRMCRRGEEEKDRDAERRED